MNNLGSEDARLELLRALNVLDSPPDAFYDNLTSLAAEVFDVPIALISLVDHRRQWFKSKVGIEATESPRDVAFCSYAIQSDELFTVNDALADERFKDNPLVLGAPRIRFYAGAPLSVAGYRIGTLCVIDCLPRELSDRQLRLLRTLASLVSAKLEGKRNEELRVRAEEQSAAHKLQIVASSKLSALGEMASSIAHEINNPLAAVMSRAGQLIDMVDRDTLTHERARETGSHIEQICKRIAKTVQSLRAFARDDEHDPMESVLMETLFVDTLNLCRAKFSAGIKLELRNEARDVQVVCRPVQIAQVLLNLLSNSYDAIQGAEEKWVVLACKRDGDQIEVSVTDSGPGVPVEMRERVMEPFFTTKPVGKGTGIGLSISQRIIHSHGGELHFDEPGTPTRISFRLSIGR